MCSLAPFCVPKGMKGELSESSGSIAHDCIRVCSQPGLPGPAQPWPPAPTSTGRDSAPAPLHWGATAPASLPAHVRKREKGKKLQELQQFLKGPLPVLLTVAHCSWGLDPTLQVNCSWDPEGTRFLSFGFKLLQITLHPLRSI